ncbi:hypothetical protein D9613_009547 [Agrocybe pediades]|uniref:DUF6534 domain-containing protein n=1 Tax=Agrocybe pediades TaxID=84607 RepID=A0A8H4R3D1_9AGAR|nr:hypothetical protein D9613_009547 [Agrocybe pediades]
MSSIHKPSPSPGVDISSAVDAIFVGYILSTVLLGLNILQAWHYARRNTDGSLLRLLVTLIVCLDVSTTVTESVSIHTYLIDHYGNYISLLTLNSGALAEFLLTTINVFVVQLFFASRAYIALVAFLALGSRAFQLFKYRSVLELGVLPTETSFIVDQGLTTLADGITTFILLSNTAKDICDAKSIFQKIMNCVVARGPLVTVSGIAVLILYLQNTADLNWMPVHLMLSKLYTVTSLAMLNERETMTRNSPEWDEAPFEETMSPQTIWVHGTVNDSVQYGERY